MIKTINLLTTALLMLFMVSCSDDDNTLDEPPIINILPSDYLINGSPWNYNRSKVGTVSVNELDLTNEEMQNIQDSNDVVDSFTFSEDNQVTFTNNDVTYSGEWALANGNITMVVENQTIVLYNIDVDDTSFSYEVENEETNNDQTQVTSWTSLIIFE